MQPADLQNPYAPPRADTAPVPFAGGPPVPYRNVDLGAALARLNQYVADPRNLDADRLARGPRVRPVAWVTAAIGAALVVVVAVMAAGNVAEGAMIAGGVGAFFFCFIAAIVLAVELSIVPRTRPMPPEKALLSYLKSISMGRFGYTYSCLSPTAREQTVATPDLRPVLTVPGTFHLLGEGDIKAYVNSFARTAGGVTRIMAIKKPRVVSNEGDVSRVSVELRFQSWPRWVSIVTIAGFVIFRPLFLVGAIAYFIVRKRKTVHICKTMLRAQDGIYYVYDGDVLEGAQVAGAA
jgi:hypothetical protein